MWLTVEFVVEAWSVPLNANAAMAMPMPPSFFDPSLTVTATSNSTPAIKCPDDAALAPDIPSGTTRPPCS